MPIHALAVNTPLVFAPPYDMPITAQTTLGITVGSGGSVALWNIGVIAGSGPAAIPVAAMLWAWQWDNWTQDTVIDCQRGFLL